MLPKPPIPDEFQSRQMAILLSGTALLWNRTSFEQKAHVPTTDNLGPGVIRRLALEAADWCLPTAELATGICQVKGIPHPRRTPLEEPNICGRVLR